MRIERIVARNEVRISPLELQASGILLLNFGHGRPQFLKPGEEQLENGRGV